MVLKCRYILTFYFIIIIFIYKKMRMEKLVIFKIYWNLFIKLYINNAWLILTHFCFFFLSWFFYEE